MASLPHNGRVAVLRALAIRDFVIVEPRANELGGGGFGISREAGAPQKKHLDSHGRVRGGPPEPRPARSYLYGLAGAVPPGHPRTPPP